jgi:CRP-like cAMP-binding protein
MDVIPHSPNHLLATLPAAAFELLRPHLETIELVQEDVLVRAGDRLTRVYSPHNAVISLVVSLAGGRRVEVAMIGRNSIFGASAALDGDISLTDAIVQLPGTASTFKVGVLRSAAEQSIAFRTTLIRHEQALFAQAQQSAACNAKHSAEARLARRLLRMHDLAGDDKLHLTQEFLAQMIGVQRNSVSTVAHGRYHPVQQGKHRNYESRSFEASLLRMLQAINAQCDRLFN